MARNDRNRCVRGFLGRGQLTLWDPDAVITGRAAAALTFWRELTVGDITYSGPRKR